MHTVPLVNLKNLTFKPQKLINTVFFIYFSKMVRSGYSVGEYSAPTRNVKRLQFGLLSPDEIVYTIAQF